MGLADDATHRVERLLERWDEREARALGKWFEDQFILKPARVPSDQKMNLWQLNALVTSLGYGNEAMTREHWPRTKEALPALAAKFSTEARADLVREVTVGGVLYKNTQNLPKASFMKMVNTIDAVFKSIHGWRRKGLAGTPTVAFAGADAFRGTAKARYNAPSDTMFVRATPAVVKRTGPQYASFEYILVHELGHRYEHLRRVHMDFGRPEWWTTPYSRTEGGFGHSEAFAELFALGHFGITNWGPQEFGPVVERFETLMTSGSAEPEEPAERRPLPEHLKNLGEPKWTRASAARVAARFLRATFQAPSSVHGKAEAEDLVRKFTPVEREILQHLYRHGTVTTEMGSHATLGPPQNKRNPSQHDYKKVQSGLLIVRDLERTKWLHKNPVPGSRAVSWVLSREAQNVFRLVHP